MSDLAFWPTVFGAVRFFLAVFAVIGILSAVVAVVLVVTYAASYAGVYVWSRRRAVPHD